MSLVLSLKACVPWHVMLLCCFAGQRLTCFFVRHPDLACVMR